jgi:hypothetical protein
MLLSPSRLLGARVPGRLRTQLTHAEAVRLTSYGPSPGTRTRFDHEPSLRPSDSLNITCRASVAGMYYGKLRSAGPSVYNTRCRPDWYCPSACHYIVKSSRAIA